MRVRLELSILFVVLGQAVKSTVPLYGVATLLLRGAASETNWRQGYLWVSPAFPGGQQVTSFQFQLELKAYFEQQTLVASTGVIPMTLSSGSCSCDGFSGEHFALL